MRNGVNCSEDELRMARYEAEEARRQLEREREERREADEARRRERQAMYEERSRTASTWPDALRQQMALMGAEVYLEDDSDQTEDHYFSGGRDACKRALVIWGEEHAAVKEHIAALEEQIRALRDGIATKVGVRLEAESDNAGWLSVAGALQEYTEDEETLSEWLNW